MKFEPCAFSVSDTVNISIDDMLPLPEEFRGVNDFQTSASVRKKIENLLYLKEICFFLLYTVLRIFEAFSNTM